MDLDKMKDTWKNADLKSNFGEEKIYKMLDKKGKTSLNKLLRFEKISMLILPFLIILPFIHNSIFTRAKYPLFTMILFISFCIVAFFWQIYKVRLLKKINPSVIDILSSSKLIVRYRKYIQYEFLIGLCWFFVFILSYVLSFVRLIPAHNMVIFIILQVVIISVSILLIFLYYKFFYSKHIKKIESSIHEIDNFDNDEGLSNVNEM